jgi:hypothetical protein
LLVLAVVAGWAALALVATAGPDPHAFRKTAANAAQGALTAVRTARLAGEAELDGRLLPTYLAPVLDNAVRGVADAQNEVALSPPPGTAEAQLRDELVALLVDAERETGLLVAAFDRDDDDAARAAIDALAPVGDRLDAFVEEHPA